MFDPRQLRAKELRQEMQKLAYEIDDAQNVYEEYEQELKRRGLKISL